MTLTELSLIQLKIPFKVSFKHSSAERNMTQSILIAAKSASGNIGLGEGCPREYVTHETVESATAFFETQREILIGKIHSLESLQDFVQDNEALIDNNPAAWCALELALLDLLAKENKQSIERLLGLRELDRTFQYTAVLGDATWDKFVLQVKQYLAMGFQEFKLKISGNLSDDLKKIALLQELGKGNLKLRVDANNIWQDSSTAIDYFKQLGIQLVGIEEPLTAMQFAQLSEMAEGTQTKIILDESFLNKSHFEPIQEITRSFIINIRISKMGGLLRSLEIARVAEQLALPIIVGAQVGETSLLTRAALAVAHTNKHNLLAQEGAFGTLLLKYDIVSPPLVFQKRGRLDPKAFLKPAEYGMQLSYQFDKINGLRNRQVGYKSVAQNAIGS